MGPAVKHGDEIVHVVVVLGCDGGGLGAVTVVAAALAVMTGGVGLEVPGTGRIALAW